MALAVECRSSGAEVVSGLDAEAQGVFDAVEVPPRKVASNRHLHAVFASGQGQSGQAALQGTLAAEMSVEVRTQMRAYRADTLAQVGVHAENGVVEVHTLRVVPDFK